MEEAIEEVKQAIFSSGHGNLTFGHTSLSDLLLGFAHAIDWTEPWILGLLLFHVCLCTLILVFRRWIPLQVVIFGVISVVVVTAPWINEYLGQNWQFFARQDYFDPGGAFISIFLSGPLLLLLFLQIVNWLVISYRLLIEVKRMQLRRKKKDK